MTYGVNKFRFGVNTTNVKKYGIANIFLGIAAGIAEVILYYIILCIDCKKNEVYNT